MTAGLATARVPAHLPDARRALALIRRWAGPAAMILGATVLVGWLAHVPTLTTLLPGSVTMKANTAIGLLVLGLARTLLVERPGSRWSRTAAAVLVVFAVAGAVATLVEYVTTTNLGIDELLARDSTAGADAPGRPAPATVFGLLLLGVGLAAHGPLPRARTIADACAALALAMSSAAILGIFYGAPAISGSGALFRLAIPTAIAISGISVAILLDGLTTGVASAFASPTLSGLFARRFGLGVLILLPMVGFASHLGEVIGLYGAATDLVFMVIGSGVVLSAYGVWAGRRLAQADEVARAADARAAWLVSHYPNGAILAFDRDLRFTLAGGAALEAVVGAASSVIGRTHPEVFPASTNTHLLRAALDGEEREFEGWSSGRLFHSTITPLTDTAGAINGAMIVGRDITEQREAEAQLKTINAGLRDFVGIVSHDLAAPIRRIQLFAEHVIQADGARLTDEALDSLVRIQSTSQRLQELVTDLLEYSRVGRQAMSIEPVDLGELIGSIVAEMHDEFAAANATVELDDLPTLDGDRSHLRQLFANLLGNALKFRSRDRTLIVRVDATPPTPPDPAWIVTVADNGRGFGPAQAEEIFGLFQRPSESKAIDGTGLGLAICRRVVERHLGSIVAEGTPDAGARFVVRLPARQPAGAA